LYLEINGGKVYAKCNVDVWKGNGGSNTKWKFVSASSTTTNIASTAIELSKSALICSVVGSETTITATMMPSNTTDIVTWTSSNSNVVSVDNGKLKAKSVGDAVITATTTSGKIATCKIVVINEKTISNGTYTIATAINNSKMLDVYKSTVANGTNVQIYSKNNSNNQKFIITKLSSGWYKIIDANSGKALDVKGGSAKDGVNVQIYDYNGTDAQLWKFYDAGNGQYFIKNKLGYYLALGSSTVSNGANVAVYSLKVPSVANQKWILSSTTINKVSVSTASVTLNQNTFTYDGKDKKPSVTSVKVNSKTLKSGTDFKVTYQNCKNVGTGSVVITGIGDYTGSKTVTFSIKLATPTLQLTGNGTSIGTSWNKIDGADGYQIKWFDSTNYDDSKKLGSSSTTSLSRTISGLKSGKTYYVRLRAYKEISGGRNYSNYVTKSVKLPNENTFDPIWPVEGSFQVNAMYYYKDGTKHQSGWGYANCIDIGNNGVNGRNIKAIESGTIIEAGWQNVSGYRVEIKHNNGTKTRYCHLQKGSITVSKGDTVSKGQVIGKMGQSGNATGVHLHLDYTGGDPWNLFKDKYKTSIKYQLNVRSNNVAKKNKDSYSKAIVEWIDQYYKKSGSYYIYK
jgi:murein DD-endopeptidase MepM/ murein hydrolase activator NlpD